MPEYCTCGTQLVEKASFCHRCGRATSELTVEAAEVLIPPPLPPSPSLQQQLAQLPMSFNNPIALRVAFLMSLAIIPVEMAPILGGLFIVWWLAAGWCAVLLYRRLTGAVLSIGAGARLGSITGVLTFVSLTILFGALAVAGNDVFQLDESAKSYPDVAKLINDPTGRAVFVLFLMGFLGAIVIAICAAGGALGARFAARKAN